MNLRKPSVLLPWVGLLFSLFVFVIHFLYYRYSFPEGNLDEASFFSPAYSLAEKGRLSSDIHKSFLPGADRYTYWMPPFYMAVLGIVFKLIGSTVFLGKFLSWCFTTITSLIFYLAFKDRLAKIWSVALFLISPFVLISSAFIRMEAMGLLIVALIFIGVKNEIKSGWLGLLAGLAFMTHPLLASCTAATAFVSIRRGFWPFFIFSMVFTLSLCPYLYYVSLDFDVFKEQMLRQLLRKSENSVGDKGISYVLQCVPLTLAACFFLFKIKNQREIKYFLAIGMSLAFVLILKSAEFNYHVYLMPYVIAATALFIQEQKQSLWGKIIAPAGLYLFFCSMLFLKFYSRQVKSDNYYKELLNVMKNDQSWIDKKIYVYGKPDISTFLIQNHQDVERQNAVASSQGKEWASIYNCVILVEDNVHDGKSDEKYPWMSWRNKKSYSTSDSHYTMTIFLKN